MNPVRPDAAARSARVQKHIHQKMEELMREFSARVLYPEYPVSEEWAKQVREIVNHEAVRAAGQSLCPVLRAYSDGRVRIYYRPARGGPAEFYTGLPGQVLEHLRSLDKSYHLEYVDGSLTGRYETLACAEVAQQRASVPARVVVRERDSRGRTILTPA